MKIYQHEINDGLAEALASNNTVACCAVAESYKPSEEAVDKLKEILASSQDGDELAIAENQDQFDLYYIKSILVSTGWNKNDDVFAPTELWEARNTPEDKPFNFMHDEKDIIGHITANEVVDFDGKLLNSESGDAPDRFNILTAAVIYTEWSDAEQKERMQKLVAEIEEGKWFVSMECLFPDFDYALANENGETKIVKRDEESAFLTKHLRSYGGDGKYEDYKVGRLLRNLSFSGKGLVSKPANPRSVILEGNDFFDESQAQILNLSSSKENNMSESYEKQISDLQEQLAAAKAASEALKNEVVAEQHTKFDTQIKELEATIAEQSEKIAEQEEANKTLAETVAAKDESLAAKEEALATKDEELNVMYKKEAVMKRRAQLEEIGFDAEEATATVEEFDSVDDETFDKIVKAMKKKGEFPPKKEDEKEDPKDKKENPFDKKKKDKKDKDEKVAPDAKAELDEEQDEAEAGEETLAGAEGTEEVAIAEAMGEDDPAESLRAVASEWLGSVLQHSNDNK
jgi:hypothetical protein